MMGLAQGAMESRVHHRACRVSEAWQTIRRAVTGGFLARRGLNLPKRALATTLFAIAGHAAAQMIVISPLLSPVNAIRADSDFSGWGCGGLNRPVWLRWTGAPAHTLSYAVTLFDRDAKTGSGWWHWIVYDLPATTGEVGNGSLPGPAREAENDFGTVGFAGPCRAMQASSHRLIATVHALDVSRLEIPSTSTPAMVRYLIHARTIRTAQVVLTAHR